MFQLSGVHYIHKQVIMNIKLIITIMESPKKPYTYATYPPKNPYIARI